MNTIGIYIIIFIVLLAVLAIVRSSQKAKKEKARALQKLLHYASTLHCTVSQHEQIDNILIGLCEREDVAVFIKMNNESAIMDHIPLGEVKKCTVNKSIRRGAEGTEAIERIALVFAWADGTKPAKQFELYHIDKDSLSVTDELQLAEKWSKIFSDNIPVKAIF